MNRHALFRLGAFGLIAAIVSVATLFGVLPRWSEIQANETELTTLESQLAAEEAELGKIIELTENRPIAEERLNALRQALPQDLAISDFVKAMNEISSNRQLDITSFSVGDPRDYVAPEYIEKSDKLSSKLTTVNGGQLQTINVDLSVSGNSQSLLSFIDDVQSMTRTNLVYAVNLSQRGKGEDSLLSMSFEIFILK